MAEEPTLEQLKRDYTKALSIIAEVTQRAEQAERERDVARQVSNDWKAACMAANQHANHLDARLAALRAALEQLIAKWRERDKSLNRKADAQPTTGYAKTLADRAECYGRCADEADALLTVPPQAP